jgi:hypothetical protein
VGIRPILSPGGKFEKRPEEKHGLSSFNTLAGRRRFLISGTVKILNRAATP